MYSARTFLLLLSVAIGLSAGESTRLTVQVNAADNGKPIDRASVIVHFRHGRNVKLKKILTSWETKTNQMGKVTIPSIPNGEITVQVKADNFQTFGDVVELTQPEQVLEVKLNRPQPQYSEHAQQK